MEAAEIKKALGFTDPSKMGETIKGFLFDKEKRENVFDAFMELNPDLSHDFFTDYFQEEQAYRKSLKQDYTPPCLCDLMAELSGKSTSTYDECCGSGGLSISQWAHDPNGFYQMEELGKLPFMLSVFNMAIRNTNAVIAQRDVISGDVFRCLKLSKGEKYSNVEDCEYQEADAQILISNPPYSLKYDGLKDMANDPRFSAFALPPAAKADFAFVLDGLAHADRLFFILPHGVLFRGSKEGEIRKKLLEKGLVEAVIGLPNKLFANTDIPVLILVLSKKKHDSVLIVDASKDFIKDKSQNVLSAEHIKKIVSCFQSRFEIEKYSHVATLQEIKENDYNLNIPRYVDSSEPPKKIDLNEVVKRMECTHEEIKKCSIELSEMMRSLEGDSEDEKACNRFADLLLKIADDPLAKMAKMWADFINEHKKELTDYEVKPFMDFCDFERSKKNKIYPTGSILLQLSATKGQMLYLRAPQKVEDKYGVFLPKTDRIEPYYLFAVGRTEIEPFLARYQTGLNINPVILKHFKIPVHRNKDIRQSYARSMDIIDVAKEEQAKIVNGLERAKQWYLDKIFG